MKSAKNCYLVKAKLGSVDSSLFFGGRVGPLGGGLILHLKMLQIVLKNLNVLKYNNSYVCNYLDILFLIAWTVNTRQFLGPNVWYRLNFLCLKCSSDLLCSVCDMTLKSSYFKRSLLFYINMSKKLYYIVQIFCLWFYTADFNLLWMLLLKWAMWPMGILFFFTMVFFVAVMC